MDNATKELLDKTSLSEYALSHLKLAGKDKENWDNKKKQNDEKLAEYSKVVDIKSHTSHTIISTLIENNSEILDKLVQDKTLSVMDNLKLQYSADLGCLSEAMRRSRFFYDIGKYDKSSKYLKYIVYILPPNLNDEIFKDKGCKSLWGLLCSLILNHNYNEAIEPFLQLRDTIDGRLVYIYIIIILILYSVIQIQNKYYKKDYIYYTGVYFYISLQRTMNKISSQNYV